MSLSVSQIQAQTRSRTLTWLVLAIIFGLVWVIVWFMSEPPKTIQTTKNANITSQDLPLPSSIDNFVQFAKEVPVVDLSTTVIRDLRNYPAEFKDRRFFEKHQNRWTVQVMDVAQNDIITGYLKGRQDREKFAYFRYHNGNNEIRYILTYGIMGSSQEALGAVKTVDFGLPKSVTPVSERMSRYLDIIDKYERTEEIVDSAPNAPRKIKLQATRNEIPAATPKSATSQSQTKKKEPVQQFAQSGQSAQQTPKKPASKPQDNAQATAPTPKPKASEPAKEAPKPRASESAKKETPKPKASEPTKEAPKPKAQPAERLKERVQSEPKPTAPEKESAPKPSESEKPKPKEEKPVAQPATNTPSTPGSAETYD
ncbi:MAG: hypothetical protein Q3971_06405 [Moraxella sp.]|nr:hypothetical protein [Moraxella sp.]